MSSIQFSYFCYHAFVFEDRVFQLGYCHHLVAVGSVWEQGGSSQWRDEVISACIWGVEPTALTTYWVWNVRERTDLRMARLST